MNLETIKEYFLNEMVIFNTSQSFDSRLTAVEKKIFFEIGLPDGDSFDGTYIMEKHLQLMGNSKLLFATREDDRNDFAMYLDLETHQVTFDFYDSRNVVYNSNLEAYLNYRYIYIHFFREVRLKQVFGNYSTNHAKYASDLERRLLAYNNDVKTTVWQNLIEEMGYGVI